MMMDSPIDHRVFRYAYHGVVGFIAARVALSLWNQSRKQHSVLDAELKALRKDDEVAEAALKEIYAALSHDQQSKKGVARRVVLNNLHLVVAKLRYDDKAVNTNLILAAVRVIQKACAVDNEGRTAFYHAGGYKKMLSLLSHAHRDTNVKVMEDVAITLKELTALEENDVVLPGDVPAGAEGAYSLTNAEATRKMLRTLDPKNGRIAFLVGVTGIFAHVAALRAGALKIAQGIDNESGAQPFLRLLSHGNPSIVEYSCRALNSLCWSVPSIHAEVAELSAVQQIVLCLETRCDSRTLNAALGIVRTFLDSPSRSKFLESFAAARGLERLFQLWCVGIDKVIRDRAELLVHAVEKDPKCGPKVTELLDVNRGAIQERRQKDQEAKRKAMQQMQQQQQFLQQMFMSEMMGGGGGGDMSEMMGGMGGDDE